MEAEAAPRCPRDMAQLSVEMFLDYVERSGLVEAGALSKQLAQLREKHSGALPDAEATAAHLIDAGLLTTWHVEKLMDRKHKGYFLGKYKLLRHIGSGGRIAFTAPKPSCRDSAARSKSRSISTSYTFCMHPMYVCPHASYA